MFLQWQDKLNIGVSEIDAEHRYLVALVNNIHDKFTAYELQDSFADDFVHLIRYVDRHFRNEEALMKVVGYPLLREHKKQHEKLEYKTADLAELFLAGEQDITTETMDFLKEWVVDHVMKEDVKIAQFIVDQEFSGQWDHVPAYSDASDSHFKLCTYCEKKWKTFDDLAADKDISEINCMTDQYNHFFNLIMFNCSCGTTLAISLTEFIENGVGNFELKEHNDSSAKPDYCLNNSMSGECLPKCACAYTNEIIQKMR